MFILSAFRLSAEATAANFSAYRAYLAANRERFPRGAYQLATSTWYYDATDPRCPHDAWLDSLNIAETRAEARSEARLTSIKLRLVSSDQAGYIELHYPIVYKYSLEGCPGDVLPN